MFSVNKKEKPGIGGKLFNMSIDVVRLEKRLVVSLYLHELLDWKL